MYYPGLKNHQNHEIVKSQAKGFGAIVSFSLKENSSDAALQLVTSTQLFKLAESLGGVKSLLSHPATMTHKSISESKRKAAGVTDSLIRLSIGLEEPEDLINDLEQALHKVEESRKISLSQSPVFIN